MNILSRLSRRGETPRRPQTGDFVSYRGTFPTEDSPFGPFRIVEFVDVAVLVGGKARTRTAVRFENGGKREGHRVTGWADELVWLEEDGAWYLPGTLLSLEQCQEWRDLMTKILGQKVEVGPPPDRHVEARRMLRSGGLL